MSKFIAVQKALRQNPDITIVGVLEGKAELPARDSQWSHTADFYVAPKIGGVYTVTELQALMMSLLPELEPTCQSSFCEFVDKRRLGILVLDEVIGTEAVRHEITFTDDDDMLLFGGFGADGKRVIERTEEVQRRIWVRLFPNAQIAGAALRDENKY